MSLYLLLPDLEPMSAKPAGTLHWTPEQNGLLALSGTWHAQPATLLLRRLPANTALETRGFHLVQEFPFNK